MEMKILSNQEMYKAARAQHAAEAKVWVKAFSDTMCKESSVSMSSKRICDGFNIFNFGKYSSF
jgi:hypothetical protein